MEHFRLISWDLKTSEVCRDIDPQPNGIMLGMTLSHDSQYAAAFTRVLKILTTEQAPPDRSRLETGSLGHAKDWSIVQREYDGRGILVKEVVVVKKIQEVFGLQSKTEGGCLMLTITVAEGFALLVNQDVFMLNLPRSIRNVRVKLNQSNPSVVDAKNWFLIAGVRRDIFIWNIKQEMLLRSFRAHSGRILAMCLVQDHFHNLVVTSSLDKTIKMVVCNDLNMVVAQTRKSLSFWNLDSGALDFMAAENPDALLKGVLGALKRPINRLILVDLFVHGIGLSCNLYLILLFSSTTPLSLKFDPLLGQTRFCTSFSFLLTSKVLYSWTGSHTVDVNLTLTYTQRAIPIFVVLLFGPHVVKFTCYILCFQKIMKHDNTMAKAVISRSKLRGRNQANVISLMGHFYIACMDIGFCVIWLLLAIGVDKENLQRILIVHLLKTSESPLNLLAMTICTPSLRGDIFGFVGDFSVSRCSKFFITAEETCLQIWSLANRIVIHRIQNRGLFQLEVLDNHVIALSSEDNAKEECLTYRTFCYNIFNGALAYKLQTHVQDRLKAIITGDRETLGILSFDKTKDKDVINVYHARKGLLLHKVSLKYQGFRRPTTFVSIGLHLVVIVDPEKGNLIDLRPSSVSFDDHLLIINLNQGLVDCALINDPLLIGLSLKWIWSLAHLEQVDHLSMAFFHYGIQYKGNQVELVEAYQVNGYKIRNVAEIWTNPQAPQKLSYNWMRRSNLMGMELTAGVLELKPFSFIPGTDLSNTYGFDVDIMQCLETLLNFTTKRVSPPEPVFGSRLENGSWIGLLGQLQRREIHMSSNMLTQTVERNSFIDFAREVHAYYPSIVKQTKSTESSYNVLIVFSYDMWLALGISVFLLLLSAQVVASTQSQVPENWTFAILGSITCQGCAEDLQGYGLKIMLFTSVLLGYLTFATISAVLTSFLTAEKASVVVDTLAAVKNSDLNIYIHGETAFHDYFQFGPAHSEQLTPIEGPAFQCGHLIFYYHSLRKTIRVFQKESGQQIANYYIQSDVTTLTLTEDGKNFRLALPRLIIGTVDGSVKMLVISNVAADGHQTCVKYLQSLVSRQIHQTSVAK
eukprot:maker-scaffold309_size213625-snap-gene-0.21 protein:Tk02553 transcript:maker-scaffold309_size213625-snap-gene-0.21-mRNA-1 annotation:"glutamate ionotropic kainate 1"